MAGTRVTIVTPSQEPTWGLPDARLLAIVNEKLEQLGVTVVRNRVMREVDTQVRLAARRIRWFYLVKREGRVPLVFIASAVSL